MAIGNSLVPGMESPSSRANLEESDLGCPGRPPKTYIFIIDIIIGIAALGLCAVGFAGYFHIGALSTMAQIDAIIMMAVGGGGSVILLIMGISGAVKNWKKCHTLTHPIGQDSSETIQTELIVSSNSDAIQDAQTFEVIKPVIFEKDAEKEAPLGRFRSQISQAEFIARASIGKIRGAQKFGVTEWEAYLGDVGKEPPLPADIIEILNSPCPFSGDESVKVKDTHMLVLIPATVNGEDMTLNNLQMLIQKPKQGHSTKYRWYDSVVKEMCGNKKVKSSYWVLMPKEVLPNSTNKTYVEQKELVRQYKDYDVPEAIEVAICIAVERIVSGACLYGRVGSIPVTYTNCAEIFEYRYPCMEETGPGQWARIQKEKERQNHVWVGGCQPSGFAVACFGKDVSADHTGISALLRFPQRCSANSVLRSREVAIEV